MGRVSNNLIGILNFLTLLLSIPILGAGIWLAHKGSTDCEKFLEKPVIAIGVFLLVVSLAGLIGACFRVSWLLWVYLLVMFLLIVLLFCFTIFAFVVTNPGAGKTLSNRGYKEYRLGDYSNWLQKRFGDEKNWNKIKSCLIDGEVCRSMAATNTTPTITEFYAEHLSAVQSGCCKPADECNFVYVSPTVWNRPANTTSTNTDCALWDNDPLTLCFNCGSCKAGVIDNLKRDWKRAAIVNIIILVVLVIVYSIGCCAFRNNRADKAYPRYKGHP
uniref:Tetraspanin-8 n=1 Tax=Kalanchoe fedtschenkoi TaxID=63787 RepID=A0A7N0VIC8_KALFE